MTSPRPDGTRQPMPKTPSTLSLEAKRIWRRLAPALWADGRLTDLNIDQLALYCDLLTKIQKSSKALDAGPLLPGRRDAYRTNPAWKVYRELLNAARDLATAFRLTPSESDVPQGPDQDEDNHEMDYPDRV